MYIFSLVLNLTGTILLAIPLVRSKKSLDDDLVILKPGQPKLEEDEKKYYTTVGFLKDKKLGLIGLSFLAVGFLIQLIISLKF
jgi:uncharacterized protein YjeT (DUF2065 family)